MNYPDPFELTLSLKDTRDYLRKHEIKATEVRLQVTEHNWILLEGDSSYDTDHHGVWGASEVSAKNTSKELAMIAEGLIEQAKNDEAEKA